MQTVLVIVIVGLAVGYLVWSARRSLKKGGCGCACSSCDSAGAACGPQPPSERQSAPASGPRRS